MDVPRIGCPVPFENMMVERRCLVVLVSVLSVPDRCEPPLTSEDPTPFCVIGVSEIVRVVLT